MSTATMICEQCGQKLPEGTNETSCAICLLGEAIDPIETRPETVDGETVAHEAPVIPEGPGTEIGPYKILQKIGEGGFGVVFMAEQRAPLERRVALKIIKPGMDSRSVIARFEAERQALAMMEHPNIAKVLDAGTTERGLPYFAMELVKGIPITKFCDEQKYDTTKRLELFREICAAVNHAHQKGIIHRDLKPSNIVVGLDGDKPVAKIIDFGIAKATQQKLTDKTLFTRFEQFVGTPLYTSPEQSALSAVDIDTRSDIYSLGVLLYEMLAGKPPFDSKSLLSAGYDEMRRIIREVEPPKPSTRLATLQGEEKNTFTSAHRADPQKLGSMLKGDLDWIVMKAIEKERGRRYETANAFGLDIQRFLDDEPVSAAAPTALYRASKFVRRNRIAVGMVTSIVILALLGAWLAIRERTQSIALEQSESTRLEAEVARTQTAEALRREEEERERAEAAQQVAEAAHGSAQRAREREENAKRSALNQYYARTLNDAYSEWKNGNQPLAGERLAQCPEALRSWEWHLLHHLLYPSPLATYRIAGGPVDSACFDSSSRRVYITLAGGSTILGEIDQDAQGSPGIEFHEAEPEEFSAQVGKNTPEAAPRPSQSALETQLFGRTYAITGHQDGSIRIAHPNSGALLRGHSSRVTTLHFEPRTQHLLSADKTGGVIVWEIENHEALKLALAAKPVRRIQTSNGPNDFIAFVPSEDGNDPTILTVGRKGLIRLWSTREHALEGSALFTQGTKPYLGYGVAFTPNGQELVVTKRPGGTTCYHFPSGSIRFHTLTGGERIRVAPDGKRIVTIGRYGETRLIDSPTGQIIDKNFAERGTALTLAFDAKGRLLHARSVRSSPENRPLGEISAWDIADAPRKVATLMTDPQGFSCVATSPCGRYIAAARGHYSMSFSQIENFEEGSEPEVWIWDLEKEALIRKLKGHRSCIFSLAFSPDGMWLASGGGYLMGNGWGELKLWNLNSESEVPFDLAPSEPCITTVAFTLDNKRLITGGGTLGNRSAPGAITVWDVEQRSQLLRLSGHQGTVFDLAFSPDGRHLVSAGNDGAVRVWSAPGFAEAMESSP